MKSTSLLFWCFISLLFIRCAHLDSSEVQKPDTTSPISTREIEDCDECPVDDCCCAIELDDTYGMTVVLRLCGTSDGTGSCTGSATGSCSSFSGGGQTASLTSSDPKFGFCMNPGDILYVQNTHGIDIKITLTCQDDIVNPQTLSITIPANTTVYFSTNGSCIVAHC